MKSLYNEQKLVTFTTIETMLTKRTIPVNDNLMSRVRGATDFFEGILNSIYSVIDRSRPYNFSPENLRKMLEFIGYSFTEKASQQGEELKKAIPEFRKYLTRFRELEDNPRRFFSDDSRVREAYEISSKIKNFYQRLVDQEDFYELTTPED